MESQCAAMKTHLQTAHNHAQQLGPAASGTSELAMQSEETRRTSRARDSWNKSIQAVLQDVREHKTEGFLLRSGSFKNLPRPVMTSLKFLGLTHPEATEDRDCMFHHVYEDMEDGKHVGLGAQQFFQHVKFCSDAGLGKNLDREPLFTEIKVAVFCSLVARAVYNVLIILYNLIRIRTLPGESVAILFSPQQQYWLAISICYFEALAVGVMLVVAWYIRREVSSSFLRRSELGEFEVGSYEEWHLYSLAMWEVLPRVCSFSALQLLESATLDKFIVDFEHLVFAKSRVLERTGSGRAPLLQKRKMSKASFSFTWVYHQWGSPNFVWDCFKLILWRSCPAVLGFLAFVGKLSVTLTWIQTLDKTVSAWHSGIAKTMLILGLMNQLMFIIDGNKAAKRAVVRFMFAGGDATMERGEWDRQEVFMACIFQRIFVEFKDEPFKRLVAAITLSTADLQRIVLEEDDNIKLNPEDIKAAKRVVKALNASHTLAPRGSQQPEPHWE